MTDLYTALCGSLGETVTLYRPTRAANATLGRNDAAWAVNTTFSAVIEQHDAERRMMYGGPLGQRSATMYCSATSGLLVREGDMVGDGTTHVWRVAAPPSQPLTGGHFECFMEEVQQPPAGVS